LALLDADEFLYPAQEWESLASILEGFSEAPAVAVNWQMFGTDGHIVRPHGSVLENFKACAASGNQHVKIIVQPEMTVRIVTPHDAIYVSGKTAVNERGTPVHGARSAPSLERLRINHYWTKSVEEYFLKKLNRGDAVGRRDRSAQDLVENEKRCVNRSDDRALRFIASR
jgi:hypothetical protein